MQDMRAHVMRTHSTLRAFSGPRRRVSIPHEASCGKRHGGAAGAGGGRGAGGGGIFWLGPPR